MTHLHFTIPKLQPFVFILLLIPMMGLAETSGYRTDLPKLEDNTGWELEIDKNGVKVYTRDWPGSNFIALKAEQMIESSLANIVANFIDIDAFPEWVADMAEAGELAPFDHARARKIYMRMHMPWPLFDRDIVSGQQVAQDPESLIVKIREWNEGDSIPEKKGVVRMPRYHNEFVLIPHGAERTRMIWQGHAEPGGIIPAFLVNWLVENVFFASVVNMRDRFESPDHFKSVSWIENAE